MTQQAESSIVDVFKERLASPFLFTFFWVSCTWNWKLIYWFLYEPLKPSIKFNKLPFEWGVICPALITVVIIAAVPWLNNAVEIIKQYAAHKLNILLHKYGWKKMIAETEYQKVVDEVAALKKEKHSLINENTEAQERENKAKEDLLSAQKQIGDQLNKLSKIEKEKSERFSNGKQVAAKIVSLEGSLAFSNDKLEKIKEAISTEIDLLEIVNNVSDDRVNELTDKLYSSFTERLKLIDSEQDEVMKAFVIKSTDK
jgi:hypothetical protein